MNIRIVLKLYGLLIILLGLCMSFSYIWGLYYNEPEKNAIAISIGISFFIGSLLFYLNKNAANDIYLQEAFLIVGGGWFVAGFFGALPYIISNSIPNFFDAFFESVSGFTTTGASILIDIEKLSKSILFWRSFTHWLGGMGIIVLFVALFPFLGVSARHLIKYETPGPIKTNLKASTNQTAKYLWYIYILLSLIECLLLFIAGMDLFNAMCHTFGTMATGGFSTLNKSIAGFDNKYIDIIITIFMILAGTNFNLFYFFILGNFKTFFKDMEFKVYILIILFSSIFVSFLLYINKYYSTLLKAFRYSIFQVVSIITTTGFCTANFNEWPEVIKLWFVVLMFIGGCSGSTGGGMKVFRIIVIIKFAFQQILRLIYPQGVFILKIAKFPLPKNIMYQILGFFILAILIFIFGSLYVSFHNIDIITSFSAVAATLWNIGPGLGKVSAIDNYYFLPSDVKFLLSIFMIIGRLELFTVIVLFVPHFWKK